MPAKHGALRGKYGVGIALLSALCRALGYIGELLVVRWIREWRLLSETKLQVLNLGSLA